LTPTETRHYEIYLGPERIGHIQAALDGPDLIGEFTLEALETNPSLIHRIKSYAQYWGDADRLARHSPHSLEEFVEAIEPTFSDLINSNEWAIVDSREVRSPIRVPTFTSDGKVRWQLRHTP
jgi:hypothetical protein